MAHTEDTALLARYLCIAARRGHKNAIVALAHALLIIISQVIARRQPYQEFGADYFHRRDPGTRAQRLVYRLARLGFDAQLPAQQISAPELEALTCAAGAWSGHLQVSHPGFASGWS